MTNWPAQKKENLLANIYQNKRVQNYFSIAFDNVYNNRIDTWDYQWTYTCINNDGLCIVPKYNMISNIGITGTHTGKKISKSLFLKSFDMYNPEKSRDPNKIESNQINDNLLFKISGIDKFSIRFTIINILAKIGLYPIIRKIVKITR
jgi:hypothetical protein